jgi:hypothetical protein
MKKLEKLNNEMFTAFSKHELTNVNKIFGGGKIETCKENCQDWRTIDAKENLDGYIEITNKDCNI